MAPKKSPAPAPIEDKNTVAIPRPRLHKLTVKNFRAIGSEPVTLELDVSEEVAAGKVVLLASVPNFEEAYFGEVVESDKPFAAWNKVKNDAVAYQTTLKLLKVLAGLSTELPVGALAWSSMDQLEAAVTAR